MCHHSPQPACTQQPPNYNRRTLPLPPHTPPPTHLREGGRVEEEVEGVHLPGRRPLLPLRLALRLEGGAHDVDHPLHALRPDVLCVVVVWGVGLIA